MSPAPRRLKASKNQSACRRCGTCCRKGGPTLHAEDRELVEKGTIQLCDLFTVRAGEMAFDNLRGKTFAVAADLIKLKGTGGSWACCRYDGNSNTCRLYAQRPLECRLLKCWDTAELERIYGRNLLSRQDLLAGVGGLWDLVVDHQRRCSYSRARQLIKQIGAGGRGSARRELLQTIQYDAEIRRLVTGEGGVDEAMLDFLFGRPMSATLRAEGLKLVPRSG